MKICPKCGKVLAYNSYFGAYICNDCRWEDATFGDKRNKGSMVYKISEKKIRSYIIKEKRILAKCN